MEPVNPTSTVESSPPPPSTTAPASKFSQTPIYSWWVMAVSILCFVTFFVGLNTVAVFGPVIRDEWSLSASSLSMLTLASMVTFCVIPVLAGSVAADMGVHRVLIVGMALNVAFGVLCITVGDSYTWMLLLRLLQGCSGGVMISTLAVHSSLWFPKNRRGFATGILMGFVGVAFSITAFVGPSLLDLGMSWQAATMWMTVVPSIVCTILFCTTVRDFNRTYPGAATMDDLLESPADPSRRSTRFASLPRPATVREVLTNRRVWIISLYGAGTAVYLYGLAYALPLFLTENKGLTLAAASSLIGLTFFFKLVAAPVGGLMSDIYFKGERYQTMMIGAGVAGVLILAVPFVSGGLLAISLITMFFFASLYGGTFYTWAGDLAAPGAEYKVSGMIFTLCNVGSAASAPMLGAVTDISGSASYAIFLVGAIGILSVFCAKYSRI